MAKRRRGAGKPPSLRERLPRFAADHARPIAVSSAWLAGTLVVVTAWILGVPKLEAQASVRYLVQEVEVRFVEAPQWAGPELLEHLRGLARAELSPDPLRRQDLVGVRAALFASGWFDTVEQVRRLHGGLVEITGRFARPIAVLREAEGTRDHLVDAQGRLMPRTFTAGRSGLPAIVGSWSGLPALPEAPWVAQEVQVGLELLRLVRGRPWTQQVREVHVHRDPADGHLALELVTDRGCRVIWGRAPGREGVGEVPAARKLEYLDYHHEHYGHIDRGLQQELDITGDVVIGR